MTSLCRVDQSWRLNPEFRSEVILVGRMVTPSGTPAEEMLSGPGAASRLWLRQLPGTGERTPIPGTGRQETWSAFTFQLSDGGLARAPTGAGHTLNRSPVGTAAKQHGEPLP
ncbi:MAG: hypothetical protein U0792_23945 [Gemmataceae bacterium]